jgi:HEAT repeat protein
MRMTVLYFLVLIVLASVVLCLSAGAQAPPTIEAELTKYKVPLTQLALQSALKDNRPEVRGLAASELSAMKDTSSVPLIVEAMESEKNSVVKFNMAAALVSLNSQAGNTVLSHICGDASLPEGFRLEAAARLVDANDLSCLSSVDDILRKAADPSNKASALHILARVKVIPASLVPRIHNALLVSLQDPDSAVRQYAAQCIAALVDNAAAPNLETAITNESDELTRRHMEESLETLKRKQREGKQ